jgi:3'(2'),5'-bisphosphate nucleotidase
MGGINRDDETVLALMKKLAISGGLRLMDFFDFNRNATQSKRGAGAATRLAETSAERLIVNGLLDIADARDCISANFAAGEQALLTEEFFLIDALDGSDAFGEGQPEFSVNIALVRSGYVVAGVVYSPVQHELYSGCNAKAELTLFEPSAGEWQTRRIHARELANIPTVVSSRLPRAYRIDRFDQQFFEPHIIEGSAALKLCTVAAGKADLYPCFDDTREWRTAAGQAVLEAAGGRVRAYSNSVLQYGKHGRSSRFSNPWFVAEGQRGP